MKIVEDFLRRQAEQAAPSVKRKRSLEADGAPDSMARTTTPTPLTPVSPATKRPKYMIYTQHPVHWDQDGNVLVQISNVRFKLQRGRLMKHSAYFRRVLSTGRDEDSAVYLDDTGVALQDFVVLLDALDDFV